jgi:hypothetical protein
MKNGIKISNWSQLVLFVFCSVVSVSAQEVVNPSVVIERSRAAIGGRGALAEIHSLRAFADCLGPHARYTTEIHSAKESRLIFRQVREGGASFVGQTNGNVFWTKDDESGDFVLADEAAAFAWRSHEFQWLMIALTERFREPAFAGRENFAGKNALKLNVKDELNHPASLFFDETSGLMLGVTILNPLSQQPESIRTVFNEWKQVGKVKLPSKVTVTDKQGDFVLSFKEISLNRVDEKIFSVPPKVLAIRELLKLHQEARAAHFNRDAKLLVSSFADDFTNVDSGKISMPTKEKSIKGMQSYFDNSTFLEWDDITPPVIKVSDDATMGYTIVHKKVRLLTKTEAGGSAEETEVFAWVAIYRKVKGQWKLTTIASTNTPEDETKKTEPARSAQ